MSIVIIMFFQPDERDGESKHDEPGHAGDDEHEQWDAGIIWRPIIKEIFSPCLISGYGRDAWDAREHAGDAGLR